MSAIVKFVKDGNGNVMLYKTQDNSLIASFSPDQNIVRDSSDANKFRIQSVASFGVNSFVLDYREVDCNLCEPIIVAENFNDFLIELSKKFFFLETTRIVPFGKRIVFKIAPNTNNSRQESGDLVIGIVENEFINANYIGGNEELLASYDI
jgi:hypothetical protein